MSVWQGGAICRKVPLVFHTGPNLSGPASSGTMVAWQYNVDQTLQKDTPNDKDTPNGNACTGRNYVL